VIPLLLRERGAGRSERGALRPVFVWRSFRASARGHVAIGSSARSGFARPGSQGFEPAVPGCTRCGGCDAVHRLLQRVPQTFLLQRRVDPMRAHPTWLSARRNAVAKPARRTATRSMRAQVCALLRKRGAQMGLRDESSFSVLRFRPPTWKDEVVVNDCRVRFHRKRATPRLLAFGSGTYQSGTGRLRRPEATVPRGAERPVRTLSAQSMHALC
jgi:hypothetical protein